MLTNRISKLYYVLALCTLLFAQAFSVSASDEAASGALLPEAIGDFRAKGVAGQPNQGVFGALKREDFAATKPATRVYASATGERFGIEIIRTRSDSGAYALLLNQISSPQYQSARAAQVGTVGFAAGNTVLFFRGQAFVRVYSPDEKEASQEALVNFARLFADTLDKGENDIPALVKHLPEWESAWQRKVSYFVSHGAMKAALPDQPVLDAVNFEGGAEAVAALYGQSHLVIVEFTTPQLATTNDAGINAKLKELRDGGQPFPTAYRRVGNYSVFVFNAPDEAGAAKLIDSIKYEQVVQWLGDDPYALQRAQRQYTETTAGVILAVLKASGLSLLLCLGVGAVFGGIVFRRRRQSVNEAFTDAGGMVRLNLDEMTQHYDAARLVGPGERR